ncbi:hypothetical protein [Bifidobacterium leontopitheci]|uniref:Peptide ABC transporter permease n=1 Tax=Bifidobacterium leontopitheci TaxID=2650774 RepID=A0A6I1GM05_9BIFI|nr:hypothetical protein [Bifidobacterium leontopitheci]KAB7790429.1 hypothetical protein F7D09_1025 [Bifidobacterium leontopitheci]
MPAHPSQPSRSSASPRGGSPSGRPRKRAISKRQRAIYRRRRIVVGVALLVVLSFAVWCVYSLGRGVVQGIALLKPTPISRSAVPDPPKSTGVASCGNTSVELALTPASLSLPVGGSLEFTGTVDYTGAASCLLDMGDLTLTITSGQDTVWRSDSCPAASKQLLLANAADMDKASQKFTWNANRTGQGCVKDETKLPNVDRGTYVAQLSLGKSVSGKVTITVQ